MSLTVAQWQALQRMAQHCAETWRGIVPLTVMPYPDRRGAALDGMIAHLAEHGWDSDKNLFRAGANAIERAGSEAVKHAARAYWWEARQEPDWLAEEVTDRVAVGQVLAALTPGELAAVLAAVDRGGTVGRHPMSQALSQARERARQLWVATGETARARYTRRTSAAERRYVHAKKAKRLWD